LAVGVVDQELAAAAVGTAPRLLGHVNMVC
jgi:hypothetical protein